MRGKTKILVFHMKELIYTLIFIALAVVLIWLLIYMFGPHNKDSEPTAAYVAGVYTSTIDFQGQTLDVQVTVDEDHINSISFVNLDESVATMYPLMEPSMDNICEQVCATQSLENLTYPEDSQYTTKMLLGAVDEALTKAKTGTDEPKAITETDAKTDTDTETKTEVAN